MHAVTRRLATAAGLLITATVTLASPPPAQAALAVVSPGEEVDYINPSGGNQFCTIGYVYTGADLHTYAITAAHCRSNPASGYARDKRSGLTGNFVRTIFESPRSGGADYALIDFHTNSIASALIDANHTLFTDDHPEPQIGETVCRIGVSSGQHCGQIAASQGQDQYLTTGMPPSIPGDSEALCGRRPLRATPESSGSGLERKLRPPAKNTAASAHSLVAFAPLTHPTDRVKISATPSNPRADTTHRH
ncbi:hypothetical protein [Mycobacterium avium]|uniref:hypothetical protein n=1 Tax=Mycobacterium avium TaxID=1764 RepID=UPI00111BF688|nr:hypothetical protein [Mycobacterium avium]